MLPDSSWAWLAADGLARPWTLLTAPLAHLHGPHLVVNLLALAALACLAYGTRARKRVWLAAALAWPLGLLALGAWPDLPRYVGLSGPLHGLAAAMVVDHLMRRRRGAPVRPVTPGDGVIALLGAGLAAKLLLEASWRQPVAWDASLEMTVIMAAHLSGTMAGGVAALFCACQGAEARKGTPKPALMEKTQ